MFSLIYKLARSDNMSQKTVILNFSILYQHQYGRPIVSISCSLCIKWKNWTIKSTSRQWQLKCSVYQEENQAAYALISCRQGQTEEQYLTSVDKVRVGQLMYSEVALVFYQYTRGLSHVG